MPGCTPRGFDVSSSVGSLHTESSKSSQGVPKQILRTTALKYQWVEGRTPVSWLKIDANHSRAKSHLKILSLTFRLLPVG